MQRRVILIADEGMMLTDGEQYAKATFLAVGADESKWYQITEAEYQRIEEEKLKNNE